MYIENLILERMKLDSGPHILGAFGRGEGAFGAVVNRLQFHLNLAANKRVGVENILMRLVNIAGGCGIALYAVRGIFWFLHASASVRNWRVSVQER